MGLRVCLYFHRSQNPVDSCLSGLAVVASCCCLYFCSCCWEWACPRYYLRNTRATTQLACWAAKNANRTSRALTDIAESLSSLDTGLTQTKMAVDFLFARTGLGCAQMEQHLGLKGFCCLDFSANASSAIDKIRREAKDIADSTFRILKDKNWGFFSKILGLPRWLENALTVGVIALVVILLAVCLIPVIIRIVHPVLDQAVSHLLAVNLVLSAPHGDGYQPLSTCDYETSH